MGLVIETNRGSGGGRAEGRYRKLILPFAVSITESTLVPFSVGGGFSSLGPPRAAYWGLFGLLSNKLILVLSFTRF